MNYVLGLMPGWFWKGQYILTSKKNGFIVEQSLYEILTNEGHVKAAWLGSSRARLQQGWEVGYW